MRTAYLSYKLTLLELGYYIHHYVHKTCHVVISGSTEWMHTWINSHPMRLGKLQCITASRNGWRVVWGLVWGTASVNSPRPHVLPGQSAWPPSKHICTQSPSLSHPVEGTQRVGQGGQAGCEWLHQPGLSVLPDSTNLFPPHCRHSQTAQLQDWQTAGDELWDEAAR